MDTKLIKPPETNVVQEEEEEEGAVMSFLDNLEELRTRLFRAVIAIAIGMLISTVFTNPVLNAIKETYGDNLQILEPTDSIVIFFRVALMLGAILASPIITYQIFMFILPGLTRKEKRWVLMALPGTTALFLFGLVFTWVILVPAYVSFLTAVLFWHAAVFETPLVFFILGRLGAVTAGSMLRYWRHAVVAATAISAFITPTTDPLTMLVITIILVALYGVSVLLVGITTGFRRQTA